jgi:hypothetical protein
MSIRKRLKMFVAICTQDWRLVTCPCGSESWIAGKAQVDHLCEDCEAKRHDIWVEEFQQRIKRDLEGAIR